MVIGNATSCEEWKCLVCERVCDLCKLQSSLPLYLNYMNGFCSFIISLATKQLKLMPPILFLDD
ncbi:hypothetical protein Syun_028923 [Stephania yunnanensis]|uniref:Uncharacterized protein n=1 Tax=Stephania yunnanensis TaxID=152371 RepID=A0AAP0ECN7_9MAGN